MALENTDVLLVNRSDTSAHATVKQIKEYILKGISFDDDGEGLTWSDHPAQSDKEISASPASGNTGDGRWSQKLLNNLYFGGTVDMSYYSVDDRLVLINIAQGKGSTYTITSKNDANNSLSLKLEAGADGSFIADDKCLLFNLGKQPEQVEPFEIIIQNDTPTSTLEGQLWWKPSTEELSISYNSIWFIINKDDGPSYEMGKYFKNAINDLGLDNTGVEDCSGKIREALIDMFAQVQTAVDENNKEYDLPGASGTLYFPAGTYRLESRITLTDVGSRARADWVIKGDGLSTKFYVDSGDDAFTVDADGKITEDKRATGGFYIVTKQRDNYITFQDMMICPKQQINGTALYLQNGNSTSEGTPSGGSNQQYGCQVINVSILPDDDKPTEVEQYKKTPFFKNAIALINYGRPRLSRVVCWHHAERSDYSFDNPTGVDYSESYGFKPELNGRVLDLTNCYSPWIDTCYFNGIANYGVYWNSDRSNTEGGTFTKLVINGATNGFYVNQEKANGDIGRHPHVSLLDSHVNATRTGVYMNNCKYFAVEHVLFYARSDRKRELTHIDIKLENCFSGTLKNSYSGGQYAAAIADRSLIPDNIEFQGNAEGSQGYDDETNYTPKRVHVQLIGNDNVGDQGTVRKNRNILVQDYNLNGYVSQCFRDNSTLGQKNVDGGFNGPGDVKWRACYEVEGEAADVTIIVPAYSNEDSRSGTFDGAQYPPEDDMIKVTNGRVKAIFAGFKEKLYDDNVGGFRAIQHQKVRMATQNGSLDTAQPIYTDAYYAQDSNGDIASFGSFRCEGINNQSGNQSGQVMVLHSYEGVMSPTYFREGGMTIRYMGNPKMIDFNEPGSNFWPSISILSGQDPNSEIPNLGTGSLCLNRNNRLYFKTTDGWKEVQLK